MSLNVVYNQKQLPTIDAPWLNWVNRFTNDTILPTVAALRAIPYNTTTAVTRAFLLGNLAIGDGGGGLYWRDLTDTTSSDNGITIIVAADSGRWKRVGTTEVSVADFGAKPNGNYLTGAGTDNSPIFQAAINACSTNGGGYVGIPPGYLGVPASSFKFLSQVTVPDGVFLRGCGKWSSLLFAAAGFADTGGIFRFNGPGGNPAGISSVGVLAQLGGVAGYGVVSVKNGAFVKDVWVNGFAVGVQLSSTDNFIQDFEIELCVTNLFITQTHVQAANGTVYKGAQGVIVTNNTSVEDGRVHLTAVRATESSEIGFGVAQGKGVILSGCSAAAFTNASFTNAALLIDTSDDVVAEGFSCKITGTPSTVGVGIKVSASNGIVLGNGLVSGFLDGVGVGGGTGVTISGGAFRKNGRHGINLQGGDEISVTGANASSNGLSVGGSSGILSNNTATTASHSIMGCITTQAGGSPQAYGINASLTDNGTATGTTIISGNTAAFNGTHDIALSGAVNRIVLGENVPRGVFGGAVSVTVTAATYTMELAEENLIVNGAGTVTLTLPPAASNVGRPLVVKTIAAHTVVSASSDVIPLVGGAAGTAILAATAGKFCRLVSDGTGWQIMEAN